MYNADEFEDRREDVGEILRPFLYIPFKNDIFRLLKATFCVAEMTNKKIKQKVLKLASKRDRIRT